MSKFENILSASQLSNDDKDWLRDIYAKSQEPRPLALNEAQYLLLREQWAQSLQAAANAQTPYTEASAGACVDAILQRLLPMMREYGLGSTSMADVAARSALNMAGLDRLASLPAWSQAVLAGANNLLLAAKDMPETHLVGVVIGQRGGHLGFNLAAMDAAVPAGTKLYSVAGDSGLCH